MTIELDYGGAGLPVNSLAPINATDDLYVAADKTVWLKTGTVAEDTAGEYPVVHAGATIKPGQAQRNHRDG